MKVDKIIEQVVLPIITKNDNNLTEIMANHILALLQIVEKVALDKDSGVSTTADGSTSADSGSIDTDMDDAKPPASSDNGEKDTFCDFKNLLTGVTSLYETQQLKGIKGIPAELSKSEAISHISKLLNKFERDQRVRIYLKRLNHKSGVVSDEEKKIVKKTNEKADWKHLQAAIRKEIQKYSLEKTISDSKAHKSDAILGDTKVPLCEENMDDAMQVVDERNDVVDAAVAENPDSLVPEIVEHVADQVTTIACADGGAIM